MPFLRHFAQRLSLAVVFGTSVAALGCDGATNPFSTESYAPSELAFEVRAEADEGDTLSVAAEVRGGRVGNATLRADGQDAIVATMGDGEKPMTWMGGFYMATVADERDADLQLFFVRGGGRHPLPVALVRKFHVTARLHAGKLVVDVAPRPSLDEHMSAVVTLDSCFERSPSAVARALPFEIDLSKHDRIEYVRANPGVDHACKVSVTIEAHNVRPVRSAGGGDSVDVVTTNARRSATASFVLR